MIRTGSKKETALTTLVTYDHPSGFVESQPKLEEGRQKMIVITICKVLKFLLEDYEMNYNDKGNSSNSVEVMESELGILNALTEISKSSSVITQLIVKAVIQPISQILDTTITMKHRHDDLIQPKETPDDHSEECTCSIAQLFLRLNSDFEQETLGMRVQEFFISMFVSLDFKNYISLEYMRHYRFMMVKEGRTKYQPTQLQSIGFCITFTEHFSNLIISNLDFDQFFDMVDQLFSLPEQPSSFLNTISNTVSGILSANPVAQHKFFSKHQTVIRYLEFFKKQLETRLELTSAIYGENLDDDFYREMEPLIIQKTFDCYLYTGNLNEILIYSFRKARDYLEMDMVNLMKGIVDSLKEPIGSMTEDYVHQTVFFDITLERQFILMLLVFLDLDLNS